MRTIIMDVLFSTSISQHRKISRKYVILCYMFYTPNNLKHVCQFCAHLNITFHLLWTGLYHVESLSKRLLWSSPKCLLKIKHAITIHHLSCRACEHSENKKRLIVYTGCLKTSLSHTRKIRVKSISNNWNSHDYGCVIKKMVSAS